MYSPLSDLVQHWYIAHSTFRKSVFAQLFHITLNTHLHKVLAIMGKLIEDFRQTAASRHWCRRVCSGERVQGTPRPAFSVQFSRKIGKPVLLRTLQSYLFELANGVWHLPAHKPAHSFNVKQPGSINLPSCKHQLFSSITAGTVRPVGVRLYKLASGTGID